MSKVSLVEKLVQTGDHWNPRMVGEVNDVRVKRVKSQQAFD